MATANLADFRKTLDAALVEAGLTVRADDLDLVKVSNLLAKLSPLAVAAGRYMFSSGLHSWAGGAATSDAKTVSGVASTDIVIATLQAQGASETLVKAVPTSNTVTFTLSANGTNTTTKIAYLVLRLL